MNEYSERRDGAYCSPFTSSACWGDGSGDTGLVDPDGRPVLFSDVKPISKRWDRKLGRFVDIED